MTQCIAVALFDFEPFKKDQLALKRRQSVRVLAAVSPFHPLWGYFDRFASCTTQLSRWWLVEDATKPTARGYIPCNYVQVTATDVPPPSSLPPPTPSPSPPPESDLPQDSPCALTEAQWLRKQSSRRSEPTKASSLAEGTRSSTFVTSALSLQETTKPTIQRPRIYPRLTLFYLVTFKKILWRQYPFLDLWFTFPYYQQSFPDRPQELLWDLRHQVENVFIIWFICFVHIFIHKFTIYLSICFALSQSWTRI